MLSLPTECQVSLTSRPQFQHYVAREIAVSAFELSSAGCVDDTQANQGGCDSDSFPRVLFHWILRRSSNIFGPISVTWLKLLQKALLHVRDSAPQKYNFHILVDENLLHAKIDDLRRLAQQALDFINCLTQLNRRRRLRRCLWLLRLLLLPLVLRLSWLRGFLRLYFKDLADHVGDLAAVRAT